MLIKKHFPTFYLEYGCKIIAATIFMTLPLCVRAINTDLKNDGGKYLEYYNNHFAFVNSMYIILSSIVPIIT